MGAAFVYVDDPLNALPLAGAKMGCLPTAAAAAPAGQGLGSQEPLRDPLQRRPIYAPHLPTLLYPRAATKYAISRIGWYKGRNIFRFLGFSIQHKGYMSLEPGAPEETPYGTKRPQGGAPPLGSFWVPGGGKRGREAPPGRPKGNPLSSLPMAGGEMGRVYIQPS